MTASEFLQPQNLLAALGILGVVFGIYSYFRTPQIKSDKDTALLKDELSTVRRDMVSMQNNFDKQIIEIKTTHIASVEKDIKDLTATIGKLSIELTRLSTILDERMPKRV